MAINLTPAGGRYAFGFYDASDIRATLELIDGQVRIRIDDIGSCRWEEFLIADYRQLLSELLKQTAQHETTLAGSGGKFPC